MSGIAGEQQIWHHKNCPDQRQRAAPAPEQPDQLCEERELSTALHRGLAAMPGTYRRALQLYYFGHLTHAELAPLLDLSLSGAKDHLYKGQGYLRRHLARRESRHARK